MDPPRPHANFGKQSWARPYILIIPTLLKKSNFWPLSVWSNKPDGNIKSGHISNFHCILKVSYRMKFVSRILVNQIGSPRFDWSVCLRVDILRRFFQLIKFQKHFRFVSSEFERRLIEHLWLTLFVSKFVTSRVFCDKRFFSVAFSNIERLNVDFGTFY